MLRERSTTRPGRFEDRRSKRIQEVDKSDEVCMYESIKFVMETIVTACDERRIFNYMCQCTFLLEVCKMQ